MAKRNAPTDRRPKGEGRRPTSAGIRAAGSGIRDQGSGVRTKTAGRRTRSQGQFPKAVAGAVRAALDKKAEDVVVLDLRKAGGFTDFFVICTGANPRQITAIADGVRDTLKRELDERPTLMEGIDRSEWILLDYFNFVVHVFSRDCRAFYGLERLWGNAERHEISDEVGVRA